jgi:hypothetical protein
MKEVIAAAFFGPLGRKQVSRFFCIQVAEGQTHRRASHHLMEEENENQ